jgi:hypothetical protein
MKKILIPLLILSTLLIACEGEAPVSTGSAFLGGTEGIVASFEPISIKEGGIYTIFDSEDFPLDVLLKNKGEENLAAGKARLRLLGPAQDDFANIANWELMNSQEIEKVTEFNPEGGEEIVSFTPGSRATYTARVTGFVDLTWNLEYMYDYSTHLIVNDVCFKGDITDPKVCKVKEVKSFSVSGAPIGIVSVEEDTAGKGVALLKIEVQNKGKGKSTRIGEEFDNRFDQISYTISEPDKWECKSGGRENEARLLGGRATIICRLKNALTEDDLYVKNVEMTFDYTYKDLIIEKLRVKESDQ